MRAAVHRHPWMPLSYHGRALRSPESTRSRRSRLSSSAPRPAAIRARARAIRDTRAHAGHGARAATRAPQSSRRRARRCCRPLALDFASSASARRSVLRFRTIRRSGTRERLVRSAYGVADTSRTSTLGQGISPGWFTALFGLSTVQPQCASSATMTTGAAAARRPRPSWSRCRQAVVARDAPPRCVGMSQHLRPAVAQAMSVTLSCL